MKVEKVKLTVTMPKDLIDEVDMLTELMGYNKREKFIESAIRRLVDKYSIALNSKSKQRWPAKPLMAIKNLIKENSSNNQRSSNKRQEVDSLYKKVANKILSNLNSQ